MQKFGVDNTVSEDDFEDQYDDEEVEEEEIG